jgi:hypothetical protein
MVSAVCNIRYGYLGGSSVQGEDKASLIFFYGIVVIWEAVV